MASCQRRWRPVAWTLLGAAVVIGSLLLDAASGAGTVATPPLAGPVTTLAPAARPPADDARVNKAVAEAVAAAEAAAAAAARERDAAQAAATVRQQELAAVVAARRADAAAARADANRTTAELAHLRAALRDAEAAAAAAATAAAAVARGGGSGAPAAPSSGDVSDAAAPSLRRFPPARPPHVQPLQRFDDGASHVSCVGSSVQDRQCAFSNLCYNTASGRRSERHPVFSLFTGHDTPQHPDAGKAGAPERVSRPCLPDMGNEGSWLCHDDRAIYTGSLGDGPLVWRPYVYHGKVPEESVAAWFDEPMIVFNRHWPTNIAHAIGDDYFPLFTLQREWLGWNDTAAGAALASRPLTADGADPAVPAPLNPSESPVPPAPDSVAAAAAAPPTAHVVYMDNHGFTKFSHRIFAYLFPHVRLWAHADMERFAAAATAAAAAAGGGAGATPKTLVCFRTAVAGAPGMSIHRNGAYTYHHARTWPESLMARDPSRYIAEHGRFVDYFLSALALPTRRGAQALIDGATGGAPAEFRGVSLGDGAGRGTVLVIDRKTKRALRNIDDVLAAARQAGGGRAVVLADWADQSTRGQAALALAADIVIAVHGAGTINSLFVRPGAAWIDLLPPRALNYAPTFMSTAQRLGVRWYTLPLREDACDDATPAHDQPFFTADAPATRAFIALALGTEARRRV